MEESLKSTNRVNLIIACKRDLPQWCDGNEAKENIKNGYSEWEWVNDDRPEKELDVIFASAGDYQTNETLAAIELLKGKIDLKYKYVNISELNSFRTLCSNSQKCSELFPSDCDIIFNFHGYPDAIKQITWNTEISKRLKVLGYLEEGTTTTPFDMEVLNKASRLHVAIEALKSAKKIRGDLIIDPLMREFEQKLEEHKIYIVQNGKDMDSI
jgi:xylulose-5-phosphate/fructose-6-phosphate phosphoketolase